MKTMREKGEKWLFVRPVFLAILFFGFVIVTMNIALGSFPPKENGFPYSEYVARLQTPKWLLPLSNFDGVQYMIIAENKGYFTYQQAYFPLFPTLIYYFGKYIFLNNTAVAGVFISLFSLSVSLVLLQKLWGDMSPTTKWKDYYWIILLLPSSFFFVGIYNESLFLMLFLLSIHQALRKNYTTTFLLGTLLGLTRLVGVFAFIPLALILFWDLRLDQIRKLPKVELVGRLLAVLSPVIGLAIYMTYLAITTGDPIAFVSAQKAFNNNRSTSIVLLPQVIYRYFNIFISAQKDIVYLVACVEFLVLAIYGSLLFLEAKALAQLKVTREKMSPVRIGIFVFSVVALILPTLSGTLSSMPRYGLLALGVLMPISQLPKPLKISLLTLFVITNICLAILFALGWFVG